MTAVESWERAAPVHPDGQLHLSLLGAFDLRGNAESLDVPVSAQRLVAYLALRNQPVGRSREVGRDQLAGQLWPASSEHRSRGSLRSALWRLGPAGEELIGARTSSLWLRDTVMVDYWAATALATRLLSDPAVLDDDLAPESRRLLSSDLLPGWYEDWVLFESRRWHLLRLHGLEALARRLVSAGRFGEALLAASTAVDADPLRETARAVLIRVHLAEGNQADAVHEFHEYRHLLQAELGLEPTDSLLELLPQVVAVTAR